MELIFAFKFSFRNSFSKKHEKELLTPYTFQGYGGGGHPTLVDVSQNFWKLVDVFFPKNGVVFEIFEMYQPTTPQQSLLLHFY